MNKSELAAAKILYDFHNQKRVIAKADFILAMGSHDVRVAEYAAQLFNQGKAEFVVCSGGFGKITQKIWGTPEADIYAKVCLDQGVPKNKIIIENQSTNSGDNFLFTKNLLNERTIKVHKGLIVSKSYLSKRALATAVKQWGELDWYIESPQISFEEYPTAEVPLERMIHLMVGDVQRLQVYALKGFQVPVQIPDEVLKAYDYLKKQGFTKFLVKE